MRLAFSKCKTVEDVEKVFKEPEVVKVLKVIKRLIALQLETSGVPKKQIRVALKKRKRIEHRTFDLKTNRIKKWDSPDWLD